MDWYKIGYNLFLGLIVLVALLMLATILPIPGNYEVRVVQSGSMEPAIHTGSIVAIKPSASYQTGDVITFGKQGATPTTHRIVDMKVVEGKTLYMTKGDANDSADAGEVPEEEVIGKVLFSIPFVGYIIDAARRPVGFFFLIILPAGVVAIEEISSIWKEIRKMKNKGSGNKAANEAHETTS